MLSRDVFAKQAFCALYTSRRKRLYLLGQRHTRECYVVAEDGADRAGIEKEIKSMPNYFADYDTTVTFISEEELKKNHAGIPHGGIIAPLISGKDM